MRPLALALLILLGIADAASATVLANWSLEEVVRRGDSVVIGTVRGQRFVESRGEALAETDVEVDEVLLGPPLRTLTVSQMGGEAAGVRTEVVGDARLEPGRRVLLITFAHQDGRRYLVGMALGALFLDDDARTLRQDVEASLVEPDGRVLPPPGERRVDLEGVRALVRARATGRAASPAERGSRR